MTQDLTVEEVERGEFVDVEHAVALFRAFVHGVHDEKVKRGIFPSAQAVIVTEEAVHTFRKELRAYTCDALAHLKAKGEAGELVERLNRIAEKCRRAGSLEISFAEITKTCPEAADTITAQAGEIARLQKEISDAELEQIIAASTVDRLKQALADVAGSTDEIARLREAIAHALAWCSGFRA